VKVKWSKKTPVETGWFWIKYKNKRKKYVVCPCYVEHFKDGGTLVVSASNDMFAEGPNHGGKGLKCHGKLCKEVRFGPVIPEPEN